MKKSAVILILFVLFITPFLSATPADDFKKQIQRAAFYSENYEAGNPDYNYAKYLIYLYSVEEELNSILRIRGDVAVTSSQLKSFLGSSEQTSWVSNEDSSSEVQMEETVPVWTGKIIFDGEEIQLKLNVIPYQVNNEILYKTKLYVIFKEDISTKDLITKFSEVEEFSKIYVLDAIDNENPIESANDLAENAVNFEEISKKLFEQSYDPYQTLLDIFGEESIVKEEDVATKEYEIYTGDKKVTVIISSCENCVGLADNKWILQTFKMENEEGQEIEYYSPEVDTIFYEEEGINGLKTELITKNRQLSSFLEQKNYVDAFSLMKEIEKISELYNEQINYGSPTDVVKHFVEASHFYAGLMEGYPLVKNSFYTEKTFQKIVYIDVNDSVEEICDNKVDDNLNDKVDCEEETCAGQICDVKTILVEENGTSYNKSIEYYCTSGECKEKIKIPVVPVSPVCGNDICEEGEENICKKIGLDEICEQGTCPKDCGVVCPVYEAIECSGNVIFKGEDENGCSLEPICIENEEGCLNDLDCEQPLCGKSKCIIAEGEQRGSCELVELEECSQPECVDGEKKICENLKTEIITEICELGKWTRTGEICEVETKVKEKPSVVLTKPTSESVEGKVWSASSSEFIYTAKNKKIIAQKEAIATKGIGITGAIIDISKTGKAITGSAGITGTGITGVVPDPDTSNEDVLTKPDASTIPQRVYENTAPSSKFTGIVGNLEGEEIIVENEGPIKLISSSQGDIDLSEGTKELFILEAKYKTDKKNPEVLVSFKSAGEKFNVIANLLESYRDGGTKWQAWKLDSLQKQNRELVKTFNNEFARWYLNEFLVSQTELSTKKNALYKIYNYNYDKKQEMAQLMEGLRVKTLEYGEDDFISVDYSSELGSIKCNEYLDDVSFTGMQTSVEVPILSMNAMILYPQDYVEKSYKLSLDARSFVSENKERIYNLGLTDKEKIKLKENTELKNKINELVAKTLDQSFDMEISFVKENENKEELIYNLFVSLKNTETENSVKIYPMVPDEVPTGIDSKISVNFDNLYSLMETTEEGSWKYSSPNLNEGFRPMEKIDLFVDWIKTQTKINSLENSIQVNPNNQDVKDVVMDFIFLLGEPSKPNEVEN